ncbi:hypothetical protein [Peribacillus simplex]|uniref:hypothetical protein n=1 Tax=Peribacillus simplex TaxID=1478 RepID=UPI003D296E39
MTKDVNNGRYSILLIHSINLLGLGDSPKSSPLFLLARFSLIHAQVCTILHIIKLTLLKEGSVCRKGKKGKEENQLHLAAHLLVAEVLAAHLLAAEVLAAHLLAEDLLAQGLLAEELLAEELAEELLVEELAEELLAEELAEELLA